MKPDPDDVTRGLVKRGRYWYADHGLVSAAERAVIGDLLFRRRQPEPIYDGDTIVGWTLQPDEIDKAIRRTGG